MNDREKSYFRSDWAAMVSTYLRSPMTIWELFLYGMTMVGLGSLLLCAFGWYGSRGF